MKTGWMDAWEEEGRAGGREEGKNGETKEGSGGGGFFTLIAL